MKAKLFSIQSPLAIAAACAMLTLPSTAQNVRVSDSLTGVAAGGGVFDYSLTLNNIGSESIESLWLGWVPGSFNISSPTSPGNNLGWSSSVDGASLKYLGTAGTALAAGHSATFTFDSTTTPTEFMNQTGQAGLSTAYGVNAVNGQLSFSLSPPDTETFSLTVAPEPSTFALLAVGAIVFLGVLRQKAALAASRVR